MSARSEGVIDLLFDIVLEEPDSDVGIATRGHAVCPEHQHQIATLFIRGSVPSVEGVLIRRRIARPNPRRSIVCVFRTLTKDVSD
jgi:hypothetical protein